MSVRKKLIICLITLITIILYKKTEPQWLTDWGIDPATYLFFSFLPIIWLFKISWKTNGFIAIFFILLTACFTFLKFEKTSENMAIMVFFFFTTSVIQRVKKLIVKNNNEKNIP